MGAGSDVKRDRMNRLLLVVLLLAPLTDLVAQGTPWIETGDRVRIQTLGGNRIIGTFVSLEVDTDSPHLTLKRKEFPSWTVPGSTTE